MNCPDCHTDAWQHPAGPCLDKWVANIVFHKEPCALWKLQNFGSAGGPVYLKQCQHEADSCYPSQPRATIHGLLGGVPRYSTEMGFAWQIVEKLTAEGTCPALINDDAGHWALSLEGMQSVVRGPDPRDMETSFIVYAYQWSDSAPLAIARAALEYGTDD